MGVIFKNNSFLSPVCKYESLPVYITEEFVFFRCIEFDKRFYGKSVYELHSGNLRECKGRYSILFPNQRISYWADSPITARTEIKKHGASNDIITFWAYDDATSMFPITDNEEPLIIIDGRKCGIQDLIDKIGAGKSITLNEEKMMRDILELEPDCLVYDSRAHKGGENFIFLEKGFKKLSIRELRLRLGNRSAKNTQTIVCADTSDYAPIVKNYGFCFDPIAKVRLQEEFLESEQYKKFMRNYDNSIK